MSRFPYSLTEPSAVPTLGLIVLQVDETIEQDFRRLFPDRRTVLHVSRIPSGDELNPDTIARMETDLPRAAGLLPPSVQFDAVGYGCTSGTALIGARQVERLVGSAIRTRAVTEPLTSVETALRRLGAGTVGVVSPYIESVGAPLCAALGHSGLKVATTLSFGEEVEARVARIDPASIRAAALEIGQRAEVEAVFLSCTNLRTLDIIDDLEATLGKPVVSSNQALAWNLARLAGAPVADDAPGRLFSLA